MKRACVEVDCGEVRGGDERDLGPDDGRRAGRDDATVERGAVDVEDEERVIDEDDPDSEDACAGAKRAVVEQASAGRLIHERAVDARHHVRGRALGPCVERVAVAVCHVGLRLEAGVATHLGLGDADVADLAGNRDRRRRSRGHGDRRGARAVRHEQLVVVLDECVAGLSVKQRLEAVATTHRAVLGQRHVDECVPFAGHHELALRVGVKALGERHGRELEVERHQDTARNET